MIQLSLSSPPKVAALQGLNFLKCSPRHINSWRPVGDRQEELDAYRTLGIRPGATKQQVKDAFYNLSKELHPDVSKNQSTEKFQKLNEAYTLLSKPQVHTRGDQPTNQKTRKKSSNIPEDIDEWIREISKENLRDKNINLDDWIRQHTKRQFEEKRQFTENARKRKFRQRQYGTDDDNTDIDDLRWSDKFSYSSEQYQNYEKEFIKKVFEPSKSRTKEPKQEIFVSRNWFLDVCNRWMKSKKKAILYILVFNLGFLTILFSSLDS